MTVAIAAPHTPRPNAKMKSGSKSRLAGTDGDGEHAHGGIALGIDKGVHTQIMDGRVPIR